MSNCSSGYFAAVRIVGIVYYPALMLIGCAANALVVMVMRRTPSMSKSRDVFTLLAVTDTCVLLVNPVRYFALLSAGFDIRLHSHLLCVLHTFLTYFLKEAATWLLVLMTMERFAFAKWPHRSASSCTRGRKVAAWCCVMLALLVKNMPILLKLRVLPGAAVCDTTDASFRLAFFITTLSLYSLLPFILLSVFNATLISIIARANKRRMRMSVLVRRQQPASRAAPSDASAADVGGGGAGGANVIRLLVPVCLLHICLTMPQCAFEILEAAFNWKSQAGRCGVVMPTGLLLVMLSSLNNGINGFVYFFSSSSFRMNFYQLVFPQRRRRAPANLLAAAQADLQLQHQHRQRRARFLQLQQQQQHTRSKDQQQQQQEQQEQ